MHRIFGNQDLYLNRNNFKFDLAISKACLFEVTIAKVKLLNDSFI